MAAGRTPDSGRDWYSHRESGAGKGAGAGRNSTGGSGISSDPVERVLSAEKTLPAEKMLPPEKPLPAESVQIPDKSSVDFTKLRQNDEFTMLLYIVQRYLSRIFSQTDSETVAYLYDVLKMPAELIEFFRDFVHNPAPEGMEQLSSVVKRTGAFIEEIKDLPGNTLISTHAIAMKGILEYLTPDSGGRYWSKHIGNCAVYAADNKNGHVGAPSEWKKN